MLLAVTLLTTACNEYVETPLPEDITSENPASEEPTLEEPAERAVIPALLVPQHNTLCVRSEGLYATIMPDGTLWVWEEREGLSRRSVPVQIGTDTDWVSVSVGFSMVALKSDGSLWAWGQEYWAYRGQEWENWKYLEREHGGYGEPFDFPPLDKIFANPIQVGTSTEWASVAASSSHVVAVKTDGTLWAWGANWFGQLGNGEVDERGWEHRILEPIQIGTDTDWARVVPHSLGTMALKTDGTLWAWGLVRSWFGDGRSGDRYTPPQTTPLQIGTDTDWVSISSQGEHTVAIKTDGSLWAWGNNWFGQIGNGTGGGGWASGDEVLTPVQIGTDTDWVAASAGGADTFALKSDGSLWAWGNNPRDWLGVDSLDEIIVTPMQVGTDTDWINAAIGFNRAALRADGSLWSWDREQDENGYPANGVRLVMIIVPVGEDL